MQPLQLYRFLLCELVSGLTQESIYEEPAAHADASMYAPDRELDAGNFQRLPPRQHVLIDAVHEGSIEIEKKGGVLSGSLIEGLLPWFLDHASLW